MRKQHENQIKTDSRRMKNKYRVIVILNITLILLLLNVGGFQNWSTNQSFEVPEISASSEEVPQTRDELEQLISNLGDIKPEKEVEIKKNPINRSLDLIDPNEFSINEIPPFDNQTLEIYDDYIADGNGTYFEVFNNEYLNITLSSSELVYLNLQSLPGMISFHIDSLSLSTSTDLILTGFDPLTTYYRYEEGYLKDSFLNASGIYSFILNITEPHHVYFQEVPSTLYISSDYMFTTDITEAIVVAADYIKIDGNGYRLQGPSGGFGIYLFERKNVTIEDLTILDYSVGIYFTRSENITINRVKSFFNNYGIGSSQSKNFELTNIQSSYNNYSGIFMWDSYNGPPTNGKLVNVNVIENGYHGINLIKNRNTNLLQIFALYNRIGVLIQGESYFENTQNNTLSEIVASYNDLYGIIISQSKNNTILDSDTSNNGYYGFNIIGNNNMVLNCDTSNNGVFGVRIYGLNNTLLGISALKNGNAGVWIAGSNTVLSSTSSSNIIYGIVVQRYGGVKISNNIINDNGDSGIYVFDRSHKNEIFGNDLRGNIQKGVFLENSKLNRINENSVSGSFRGFYLLDSSNNILMDNEVSGGYSQSTLPIYRGIDYFLINSDNNLLIGNKADSQSKYSTFIYDHVLSYYLLNSLNNTLQDLFGKSELYLRDSSNNTLNNNQLDGVGAQINLIGGSNNSIIANRINGGKSTGMMIDAGPYGLVPKGTGITNNIIKDNIVSNCIGGYYTDSWFPDTPLKNNNSFINNTAQDNTNYGFIFTGVNSTVRGNVAKNNGGTGFVIYENNLDIRGNTAVNNFDGFELRGKNVNLIGNKIIDNVNGILLITAQDNTFIGNIIKDNDYGLRFYNDDELHNTPTINNLFYHNSIINNIIQVFDENYITQPYTIQNKNDWHEPVLLEGNYWSDYSGLDDGSGVGVHAVADDGIGDTDLSWPDEFFDFYPLMEPRIYTPSGINIEITDPVTNTNITYSEISKSGETIIKTKTQPPAGARGHLDLNGFYYQISTTATYSGDIEICIEYDDTGMSVADEENLRLWHYEETSPGTWEWVDVTIRFNFNLYIFCGRVSSYSWFGVGIQDRDSTSPPNPWPDRLLKILIGGTFVVIIGIIIIKRDKLLNFINQKR